MKLNEYQKMYQLEKKHWWFCSKRKFIHTFLKQVPKKDLKILEVGCGTGLLLTELERYGKTIGVDKSKQALYFCRKRNLKNVILASAEKLPFKNKTFDLVVASDLLEHIEYDLEAIGEFRRVCKLNGYLLLTVPAFKFLWSSHDIALYHKRRYTKAELINKLRFFGFDIVRASYSFFFVFPMVALVKTFSKKEGSEVGEFPTLINSLLIKLLSVENYLLKGLNMMFGSTIICLAQRVK